MFTLHIHGLCLAVNEDSGLTALLLNSATDTELPLHVPSIFAPRSVLIQSDLPRLGGTRFRWASNRYSPEALIGWDITGLRIRVGTEGPVEGEASISEARYPARIDKKTFDWSDLHWILDAQKMLPTGKLRDQVRYVGDDTTAMVELHGGVQRGGVPFGIGGSLYEWTVRPGYTQGFTDTLDVVFDGTPEPFEAFDCDGRYCGMLQFADGGEAWLVNEAPQRATTAIAAGSKKSDATIYLTAFNADQKEKAAVVFKRGKKMAPQVPEGESCNMTRLDLRTRK